MSLDLFHPAVSTWFQERFGPPTEAQARAWPSIRARRHTLVAAPTGSGKTLSAFLAAIDDLVRQGLEGRLEEGVQVVYVSPLKALSNDIERNLEVPLEGIGDMLERMGLPRVEIRRAVRTGDTPAKERAALGNRPPHLFVTTPESLYILLTSESGRQLLRGTRTVIVDEIHAMVGDKRGSHLALSLERLDALCGGGLVRIGLSATQRPIEDVARFLAGGAATAEDTGCTIVDLGHRRKMDLKIEVPDSPLETVMSGEVWGEVYDRLAALIREHRTTLVFCNTRRLAERLTAHLSDRLGPEHVTSHHGSLSREHRLAAERRLKAGELKALVATASLELGIDIGDVDLVCQVASTRSISTLLQRVGRSGHNVGGLPKGRLFPTSRDELVECVALLDALRRGELDMLEVPQAPLDILAQQIVAAVAAEEWDVDTLFELMRRAWPYRSLSRASFDDVIAMLAEGFSSRRGRRGAWLFHDAVNGRLKARKGARLAAMTSGGAIPDNADYDVVLDTNEMRVGSLNEDFAIESMPGDIFQLGNTSWQIVRIEAGRVRVRDAAGQPPTLPFWLGEARGRSGELSFAVARLREEVGEHLGPAEDLRGGGPGWEAGRAAALDWLSEVVGVAGPGAQQVVDYLAFAKAALGELPSQKRLVLERFFDESGGMQLVVHAPFGSRLNRAWGLALRKRFCRSFNFELQAAATEEAILLSLGPTHSFPLEDVFHFLHSGTVRGILVQALLDAPMFGTRWRWNASRALAVLRYRGGKKVPPRMQRYNSDDLVSVVFPDQLACLENIAGDREIPDHPLVEQTIRDCLEEAMDIEALEALLRSLEAGERTLVARDLREPSPLSLEIVSARPYAFLDDAPLEERRTLAVRGRRFLDPRDAADLGALDADAIERVRAESWPTPRDADELHDALSLLGFLHAAEGDGTAPRPTHPDDDAGLPLSWEPWFTRLVHDRRACRLSLPTGSVLWAAAERLPELLAVHPAARPEPPLKVPERQARVVWEPDVALKELMRGRMESCGPTTSRELADLIGLPPSDVETALIGLEAEGFILRGHFRPGGAELGEHEWCERRLLARIHRGTLDRLRREIEPVTPRDFLRFLLTWQHTTTPTQVEGPEGLWKVLCQLEGFDAPATGWEGDLLPGRVKRYDPAWLDSLCLSGRLLWYRARRGAPSGKGGGPVRGTPICLVPRDHEALWGGPPREVELSPAATKVLTWLEQRGASFFHEITRATGLMDSQAEDALGELVSAGRVSSDGFSGLRGLVMPTSQRSARVGRRGARHDFGRFALDQAGRWSVLHGADPFPEDLDPDTRDQRLFDVARALLLRWGVVFRKVLEREEGLPPWRDLLRALRRLEARGEIRGGRFVSGFAGEQFALPEAIPGLRAIRRAQPTGELVAISGADPLNLVGILTPDRRLPSLTSNRVLYRDGEVVATLEGNTVSFVTPPALQDEGSLRKALIQRQAPGSLKAYLGRGAAPRRPRLTHGGGVASPPT